ncbi:MAG: phytanoyl-CoA dioxygenase family protein [Leptolyngbyaceae cyanobacterium SU_3_3]|nr:phytanoyl-CoA dioxygenase family protein [Leptolyngbyaceae cyanobacterium SU_3_3]
MDVPYWSFTSLHAISVWIALDDATLENGCMYFMPGSHKVRYILQTKSLDFYDRSPNIVTTNRTIYFRK